MAQIRAAKEQEQKLVLLEQAKAHPMVKQALEIFGAELAEVRTDLESQRGAGMKNPLGNMANIMKQAQAMQAQMAKLQEEAATKTVTGTAGGGMVTRNGERRHGDREHRDRSRGRQERRRRNVAGPRPGSVERRLKKARQMMADQMKSVTGGMNIPGLLLTASRWLLINKAYWHVW